MWLHHCIHLPKLIEMFTPKGWILLCVNYTSVTIKQSKATKRTEFTQSMKTVGYQNKEKNSKSNQREKAVSLQRH